MVVGDLGVVAAWFDRFECVLVRFALMYMDELRVWGVC